MKSRELINFIESNFGEETTIGRLAVDSLQEIMGELDEKYKKEVKNDILDELLDVAKENADGEIDGERMAEIIRAKQYDYHNRTRGWP